MSAIISPTYRPTNNTWYAKNTVPKLLIEATENVTVTLYFKDQEAQEWQPYIAFRGSYSPDFNGEIWVDFNGVYDSFISTKMPTASQTSLVQDKIWYYFRVVVVDSSGDNVGTAITWQVFNAKLNSATPFQTWSQQNFLTNQPMEKTTNYEAPEWLTYLDLDDKGDRIVIGRFYPKEGGAVDCIVNDDACSGCFSVNVNYARLIPMVDRLPHQLKGYYDIVLTDGNLNEICRQRYIYKERSGREKYFLFVNALGGIDTLICKGENVLAPDITHNIGRFGRQYRALDDTNDMRKWTQHIGQVPNHQRNWIYELLTAKQGAEKYDPETMEYLEIVVDSSELSMSDFGQLAGSPFSYILNDTENVVADTERPDRSLHQSVADQAEELNDRTTKVTVTFVHGATEPVIIHSDALYVLFDSEKGANASVYYFTDGIKAGEFKPGVDESPVRITIKEGASVHFETEGLVRSLELRYYPTNNI